MADITRPRLPPLRTQHARNASSQSGDSDSSDSSPDRETDEDAEGFTLHPNDSASSIGALTVVRDCDMEIDMEQKHRISPISKLPPELLIGIFQKLTTTADLRNCMLVSYDWALCTVSILWHRPLCNKWNNLQNVARTLSDSRQTFPYHDMVKRLNLSAIAEKVNNGTVQAFRACKGIERLTLTSCVNLTDSGVEDLVEGSRRLQALDVTDLEHLTDRTLHRVAENCPKLQGLNVTNCSKLTDESLTAVAKRCTQLKRLKLNGLNKATDTSITAVARNCRSILEIDLAGCASIRSESVTALLSNLPHLRELRLAQCSEINDSAFTNLQPQLRFEALRILDLTACEGVRDDAIAKIIPAAPRLRNLVLSKCRHITDEAVRSICRLTKNLHYIHLGHCMNLTDAAVIDLVQQCNRIRYIDLACCSRLTDASVRHLAKLPKLRRIGLVKCQNLTDASIIALARGPYSSSSAKPGMPTQFVSLERVHLSYCVNLTLKGITQLLLNCPRLTHLSLTGVQAFLRDDLTRFCRDAPPEFTHPQRDVFCVFSGDGVTRLRDYLTRLALEEQEREQQSAVEERLMGPDSPDADSMSDDGTIDGTDQQMDFVYGPGRHGIPRLSNIGHRPRPRSLHELPSYHVDMPLLPEQQMQRMGPWTPGQMTPEMRAGAAPAHLNLMSSGNLWYGDVAMDHTRNPLPTPNMALDRALDDRTLSRNQSRRHTLEYPLGFAGPSSPGMYSHIPSPSRYTTATEDLSRATPLHQTHSRATTQAFRNSAPGSTLPVRQDLASRQSFLRPDPNVSAFDFNQDHIMATVPASREASRGPSRSNSPHIQRVSSRSRMGSFFGNLRAFSSSSFNPDAAVRPHRINRSREASQHRDEGSLPTLQHLRPTFIDIGSSSRHPEMPLLPPELVEHIAVTPITPTDSPGDMGFVTNNPNHHGNDGNDGNDVNMTH